MVWNGILYLFSQGPTRKRQNKSLVHQKYADFVRFSWKCVDRNSAKIYSLATVDNIILKIRKETRVLQSDVYW
jgi:hypothetical protein